MIRLVSRSPAWTSSPVLRVRRASASVVAGDSGDSEYRVAGQGQRPVEGSPVGGIHKTGDHAAQEVRGLDSLFAQGQDGIHDGSVVRRIAVMIDDELTAQSPAGVVFEDLDQEPSHRLW